MERIFMPFGAARREMRVILRAADDEDWRVDVAEIYVEEREARGMFGPQFSAASARGPQQNATAKTRLRKILPAPTPAK